MRAEPPAPDSQLLFDGAPCALLVTDEDGTIRLANAAFCEWTGFDAAGLVGERRWHEMLTIGGRIFYQTHIAPLLRMQGSVAEVKVDILHRNGHAVPLFVNAVRRQLQNAVRHELAFFTAKDRNLYERELVDARRRAEESLRVQVLAQQKLGLAEARLRLAMNSGSLFVWEFDPETQECRYEDGVALLLGYREPRSVIADMVLGAMSADDRDAHARILNNASATSEPGLQLNVRLQGRDGVPRVVSVTADRVVSDAMSRGLFVGVLQDISEHSRLRGLAEDRARFAEQMVGIVSHDLRNPLSTIKMAAKLLARDSPSERQSRFIGHIDQAADRAKRLIYELLDFTMVRVGQGISVTTRRIDLHSLVRRGVAELELAFPAHPLEHHAIGSGECEVDPDRLIQLLGNLVANAVTYGAESGPIVITTTVNAAEFVLSVQNQGVPIPSDLLNSMFEPMTRGEQIDDSSRSVGLGLFIVRAIAHAHAGSVDVTSTDTDGTVFRAIFPRLDLPT